MAWGFGSFVVLALLMRYYLYPRLRKGMDARYALIRGGHEQAEQVTDAARADVAQYEGQLAAIKAEAQQRIEAARATLDSERAERLTRGQRPHRRDGGPRRRPRSSRPGGGRGRRRERRPVRRRPGWRAGDGPGAGPRRRERGGRRRDERGGEPMIALADRTARRLRRRAPPIDDQGYVTSHSWIWPEQAELIYGTLASVIIIGLLVWKAGPMAKKAFAARTERIQAELDESAKAKTDADANAARIREALGDVDGERQRMLADADTQAAALLADGRARLDAEIAELEAKAEADIAAAAGRTSDELRNEIARLASAAADRVVERSLDAETQQRLVEDYIQKVGAA